MHYIFLWKSVGQWNYYAKCNFLLSELAKWVSSVTYFGCYSLQSNTTLVKGSKNSSFLHTCRLVYLLPASYTGNKMAQVSPMGKSFLPTPSLWRQNCSENKVPNSRFSCALSVGFLNGSSRIWQYSFPVGYSCANSQPAHLPCTVAVINILASILFPFQI